jgi:hypothetical protein
MNWEEEFKEKIQRNLDLAIEDLINYQMSQDLDMESFKMENV